MFERTFADMICIACVMLGITYLHDSLDPVEHRSQGRVHCSREETRRTLLPEDNFATATPPSVLLPSSG